jgi:hypothetical protein
MLTASIISAAIAAGTAIYGAVENSRARKRQAAIVAEQKAQLDKEESRVAREEAKGYLNTAQGSAIAAQAKEGLQQQANSVDKMAAATGATHEAQTAARQGAQSAYANAMRGIASNANQWKAGLDAQRNNINARRTGVAGAQMNMEAQNAQSAANLTTSGINTIGAAASTAANNYNTDLSFKENLLGKSKDAASENAGVDAIGGKTNSVDNTKNKNLLP